MLFLTKMPDEAADKMLFAALELFTSKGFKETSILDVALLARVSKTTFYQHFSNKEDLLARLCGRLAEEILEEVVKAVQSKEKLTEKSFAGIHRYIELCMEQLNAAKLLLVESVGVCQEVEKVRREAHRRFAGLFYQTVNKTAQNQLSKDELRIFAQGMVGAINEVVVQNLFENVDNVDLETLARLLNRMVVGTYITLPR